VEFWRDNNKPKSTSADANSGTATARHRRRRRAIKPRVAASLTRAKISSRHRMKRHHSQRAESLYAAGRTRRAGRGAGRTSLVSASRARITGLIPRCIGGDEWPRRKRLRHFLLSAMSRGPVSISLTITNAGSTRPVGLQQVTDAVEWIHVGWTEWFTRTARWNRSKARPAVGLDHGGRYSLDLRYQGRR